MIQQNKSAMRNNNHLKGYLDDDYDSIFSSLLSPDDRLFLTESLPRCHGCQGIIFDRFILKLGQENERHTCWHSNCLVCSDCHVALTVKCYLKNGQVRKTISDSVKV